MIDFRVTSDLAVRQLADGSALQQRLTELRGQAQATHDALVARRDWPLGWIGIPQQQPHVVESAELAQGTAEQFDTLIVCGIGGSALGTQAVYSALDYPGRGLRRVYVLDNVDPTQAAWLAERFDLRRCAINVISKSGTTLETMAGFEYVLGLLEQASGAQPGQIIATTDPRKGLLREMAMQRGWYTLPVPDNVGGRFSVLTPVGLFPLAFAGVDLRALLDGAARAQEQALANIGASTPWQLTALHYLLHLQGGCNATVQYVYGDPLVLLGDWFRQLWGESLPKAQRLDGDAGAGCLTPLVARGSTDQHSQNQLYMEGVDDKLYGFVSATQWPTNPQVGGAGLLTQRSFGELLEACRVGTRDALVEAGRPVYELTLAALDEASVGAYLQTWMLATTWAGMLYGVNPFDQPGVERSKVLTKAQLGL